MKRLLVYLFAAFLPISAAYAIAVDSGMLASTQGISSSKILVWRTESYLARVDITDSSEYRLALWDSSKNQQDIPETIIVGGALNPIGSGGSYCYEFTSNKLTYRCYIIPDNDEGPEGYLTVSNEEKEILSEPVLEVISSAR